MVFYFYCNKCFDVSFIFNEVTLIIFEKLILMLFHRLVDIICEKMTEGNEADGNAIASGANSALNMRGGPSSGTTRLTDKPNNVSNQSCQC